MSQSGIKALIHRFTGWLIQTQDVSRWRLGLPQISHESRRERCSHEISCSRIPYRFPFPTHKYMQEAPGIEKNRPIRTKGEGGELHTPSLHASLKKNAWMAQNAYEDLFTFLASSGPPRLPDFFVSSWFKHCYLCRLSLVSVRCCRYWK